jgi:dolichol-phosphate mannosyltransferase
MTTTEAQPGLAGLGGIRGLGFGHIAWPQQHIGPRQTVVVPTYNERDNVAELLTRLSGVLPAGDTEIVFVDDSTDDTPDVIRAASAGCAIPVTVHHRDKPVGGLGGAVVEGLRMARGAWVVVMDGDLQHPPEVVPQLVAAGVRDGADVVVASRYAEGGSRGGLADRYRRFVSACSTVATKLFFRTALTQISDPMSGFFAVRRSSLETGDLRPLGYKILLELMVRNRPGRVVEVPYTFQPRYAGESKSTVQEGLRFLRHVAVLRAGDTRLRLFAYGLVGVSGLLPNLFAIWVLSGLVGVHYLPAAIIANQVAITWNFVLTEMLFHGRRHRRLHSRITRFFALGNIDLVLRVPALAILVGSMGLGYMEANVITLAVSFLARFAVIDRVIYVRRPDSSPQPALDVV